MLKILRKFFDHIGLLYSNGLIPTNQINLYRKNPKDAILQNYFEPKRPLTFTEVHHQANANNKLRS
jgi:hypothetical protein